MSWKIRGKVTVQETGKGIDNLRVKAIDKDLLFDDLLGAVRTDEHGDFVIEYDARDFQELFFDNKPDIYLEVMNHDGELIHTTESKVRYDAAQLEEFDIRIPARLLRRRSSIQSMIVKPGGGTLRHPDGLSIQFPAGAFDTESSVEISSLHRSFRPQDSLGTLGGIFCIRSTAASAKRVGLSLRLTVSEVEHVPVADACFFLELEEGKRTRIVPATIRPTGESENAGYLIEAFVKLAKNQELSISAGAFLEGPCREAFHPVPHYFKTSERGSDEHGHCRREGSDGCKTPPPQAIYPACFPAAQARLFGAYNLVLPAEQRRWHVGTPTNANPDPDEDGDHFSPAATVLPYWRAVRVEDWHAGAQVELWDHVYPLGDPSSSFRLDPSYGEHLRPGPVDERLSDAFRDRGYELGSDAALSAVTGTIWELFDPAHAAYFLIKKYPSRYEVRLLDRPVEDAIAERAREIKGSLQWLVSGPSIGGMSSPGRPVCITHAGHAWNIVGVEGDGYWSHGENDNTDALSAWCRWENAPWLDSSGERCQLDYHIKYPKSCELKPRGKRLGSISMWGSGGNRNHLQFVDLPSGKTIDWTPHMEGSSAGVGYLWIEDGCRLNARGIPISSHPRGWDDDLGAHIPVPENDFGRCSCGNQEGCPRCRTRLNLPFWVHNTTLDESLTYKVDLYFWTVDDRWVRQDAHFIQPVGGSYPCFPPTYPAAYSSLPGPAPGRAFELRAVPDTSPGPSKTTDPFNWQPVAWYVDFHRNQFSPYNKIHGIKLVLTCTDNCLVQDVRQLWFRSQHRPVI